MHLPFLNSIRRSKFNGFITVTRLGEVWAYGVKQTSIRYPKLWDDAFAHAAPLLERPVHEVLLLGLGGGGVLPALYERYPDCAVTAIEHDPLMLEIAKELTAGKHPFPTVLIDDAQTALRGLAIYDLVLVDIFTGGSPSPLVHEAQFWQTLSAHLAPGGVVILNVATKATAVYEAQKHFATHATWQYDVNTFCALRC